MAFKIRAGVETRDLRLDRIQQFDERSKAYPIRDLIEDDGEVSPVTKSWPCRRYLNQGAEGACFPTGTYIRMADGSQKTIESVLLLEEVVTAEGGAGTVVQTMVRPYEGDMVGVKLRGHHRVFCTPEHPFLTKRGYIPAQDLQSDDYVAVTRYLPALGAGNLNTDGIRLRKFRGTDSGVVMTGGVRSVVSKVPVDLSLTYPLGRIIGLYAAEGHTTDNKVVWTFGNHERDTLVKDLQTLLLETLHITSRLQERSNGALNVVAYGKPWRVLFSTLVPGTSKHGDKHLSPYVTSGNSKFLEGVLEGWLEGDGHRRRTSYEGISVCSRLALDMHAIANGLGKLPTISVSNPSDNEHAKSRQLRWSVTLPEGGGQNLMEQTDTAVWRKVSDVSTSPYRGYVFNLHVEGDESYVAEGVGVHNCVGFAWGHELIAKPEVINVGNTFAREKIYWEAQKIDEWTGGAYPGADPFYEGTSVLAGAKVVKKLGYITEYRWAFSLEDLVLAVGHEGPAVIGIPWYEGMFNPMGCGFLHISGEVAGGHAILVRGVNVEKRHFSLHNSWGKDWGFDGRAKITWDEMERLLYEGGEACIPVGRKGG